MHGVLKNCVWLLIIIASFYASPASSHSGRLNSQGCHGGSQPYHCHRSANEMVPSSSGGSRLRCSAGSRSKDCIGNGLNQVDTDRPKVNVLANATALGG